MRENLCSRVHRIVHISLVLTVCGLSFGVTPASGQEFRSIDGSGNHPSRPDMGAAGIALRRLMIADYSDSMAAMAGSGRPGARAVSNAVCAQDTARPNSLGATDYLWQWGQFVDHDLDLTEGGDPAEAADIQVPMGDRMFDPFSTGEAVIPLTRSVYVDGTGTDASNPRQQRNDITAWIDGSNVYGSSEIRATALRENDGTGRLRTSDGGLLPLNTDGLPNAGGDSPALFLGGDVRANEQVGLTAMHTLFVREHNRIADLLRAAEPELSGDGVYERARREVGALLQVITFQEFLPALLGPDAIPPYVGHDPTVDASILNLFSTASYRFGHSALNSSLLRLGPTGDAIPEGHLRLRDAFFAPHRLAESGIDPLLRGLAAQACQAVDSEIIDDVRNFLFGPPGSGGFDLASLNIQRGRDHGLPSYNYVRHELGLPARSSFAELTSDTGRQARLASVYSSVDDVDLWVGALAEDPLPGSHLGELNWTVVRMQFLALRDGDGHWYSRTMSPERVAELEATRLSDVIRRNTAIGDELQDDVFRLSSAFETIRRGDSNSDGSVDLGDAIATLNFLFRGGVSLDCLDAADADDSGSLDLGDALGSLSWLFFGAPAPAWPGPGCGVDPTLDEFPSCESACE